MKIRLQPLIVLIVWSEVTRIVLCPLHCKNHPVAVIDFSVLVQCYLLCLMTSSDLQEPHLQIGKEIVLVMPVNLRLQFIVGIEIKLVSFTYHFTYVYIFNKLCRIYLIFVFTKFFL